MKTKICALILLWLGTFLGFAQGFVNLDFEAANNLGSPDTFGEVNTANAFPGWTVSAQYIVHNDFLLNGESIAAWRFCRTVRARKESMFYYRTTLAQNFSSAQNGTGKSSRYCSLLQLNT